MNNDENVKSDEDRQEAAARPAPSPQKAQGARRKLVTLALALILLLGVVAVARQFYGKQLLPGWLSAPASKPQGQAASKQGDVYYCPMHTDYKSDKPGNCPICSMQLVKMEKPAREGSQSSPSPASPAMPGMDMPQQTPTPGTKPAPEAENTIFVSPQQQQLIGVQTAPATLRVLEKEIRTVGRITYDERKVAHIHTKISGWIEQVFVDFVGKVVGNGDPLFTIYSPDLVATQEEYLLALRARREFEKSSFERVASGAHNLLEATRRRLRLWDVTDADVARLEKEGTARRELTIFSPVSGLVTERAAYHHGRYVTPEMDLYTIVDLSTVWVLGEIYEYELPHVRVGLPVEVEMPYESALAPARGTITYVYPFLNPTTRTAQIRMEFVNRDGRLRPDMFVNVKLRVSLGRQLTVPEDAVLDTGTQQYVFVDKGQGYFEPRLVKVGGQAAGYYAIKEGLKPAEKVATAANFILDSESRLKGAFAAMGRPPAERARPEAAAQQLDISLRTEPEPAKVGDNTVRVRVADPKGMPVQDASVRVRIFMPAMGSMAPMSSEASLTRQGNGEYSGRLNIPMAWTWQTTVTVERGGQVLGSKQVNITAR